MAVQKNGRKIQPYQNNAEFLQEALERLELLLQRAVLLFRQDNKKNNSIASWQAVTDQEVDNILFISSKKVIIENQKQISIIEQQLTQKIQYMIQRLQESYEMPISVPMVVLQKLFNLSLFELDILIICLAPTLDMRYGRLYAYLQDHIDKTSPSSALIFLLLAPTLEQRIAIKSSINQELSIVSWEMIQTTEGELCHFDDINYQQLKITSDINQFLLDTPLIEDPNILVFQESKIALNKFIIPKTLKLQLQQMLKFLQKPRVTEENSYLWYFYGDDQAALYKLVSAFFKELSLRSYILDAKMLLQHLSIYGMDKTRHYLTGLLRKNLLDSSSVLMISNADILLVEEPSIHWLSQYLINKMASAFRFITFVGNNIENFKTYFLNMPANTLQQYSFYLSMPDYALRLLLWQKALQDTDVIISKNALQTLANTFHFSETQIITIVNTALRDQFYDTTLVTVDLLLEYCKAQNKGKLTQLSQLQPSKRSFEDLVLPEKPLSQLEAICTFKKHHQQVYHQWNFSQKMQSREGIVALFHGVSGTGKTMAATIIAKELNLELYRIDLALMVSKYIGETEKNLKQIFDAAKTLDVILFFDEADTLFSKRTNVNDAHDRYANIETGYLLQRIEEYPGIVILATNLLQNVDEAFLRRFHFIVDFQFPDTQQRKILWQKAFPQETPLDNIDYDFLAEKIKLAGGNISNIALHGAFLAAQHKTSVAMPFLLQAARDEYHKLGKLFVEKDYKPYL